MIKIIHTADLHLTSEEDKAYSYAVLSEIIGIANEKEAAYLIFAGDVFNRFTDLDAGKNEFKSSLSKLRKECEVIYIAGNHESLDRKKRLIGAYDLGIPQGNIVDMDAAPYAIIEKDDIQFFCVPHQTNYSALSNSEPIPRSGKHRIAVAHGILTGSSLASLIDDEEEQAVVIDASLFERHQADFVCLGHIHKQSNLNIGKIKGCYPGSPRVWRKGETGKRQVNYIEIDAQGIRHELLGLAQAGEYRAMEFFVSLDDNKAALQALQANVGQQDYVFIEMHGIADDAQVIENIKKEIKAKFSGHCRRIEIDSEGAQVLAGISGSNLAKSFLSAWNQNNTEERSEFEQKAWLRARELALLQIKAQLEK